MKGRFPSKFQISSPFGSSFILEGLWICVRVFCVCVCMCVRACFTPAGFCFFGPPYKNRHNFFAHGGFWCLFSWLYLLTVPNMSFYQLCLPTLVPDSTRLKFECEKKLFFYISIFFCLTWCIIFFSQMKTKLKKIIMNITMIPR